MGIMRLICLLLVSYSDLGASECLTSSILGTQTRDVQIDIQEFDLNQMMGSVLDLTLTAMKETFGLVKQDIIRTDEDNDLCSLVGEGVNLQSLDRFNRTFGIPILTSARIVSGKILIQGQDRSTLIDLHLLSTLLTSIELEDHVDLNRNPALVFLQTNNRRLLTNFDGTRANLCKVRKDVLSLGTEATSILSKIKEVYISFRKINELFSDIIPFETFESCIGTPGDFESLLGVSTDRFQHCLTSCFSTEDDERSKRSSWLGFLLSDGAQVDALSSSLSETIDSYNTNFNKIQDIDKKLIIKFNELALKLSDMSSTEHLFRDLILSIQIQQQQDKNSQIYFNLKSHHMTAILNMLEKSTLHEEIDIIQRSLFHQNQCGLVFCETDIFSRREQGKIVVHRELLKLAPSMDLYVQCKALSPTHVSQYHNTVGQNADCIAGQRNSNSLFTKHNICIFEHPNDKV